MTDAQPIHKKNLSKSAKYLGVGAFMFFFIKGLVWIGIAAAAGGSIVAAAN